MLLPLSLRVTQGLSVFDLKSTHYISMWEGFPFSGREKRRKWTGRPKERERERRNEREEFDRPNEGGGKINFEAKEYIFSLSLLSNSCQIGQYKEGRGEIPPFSLSLSLPRTMPSSSSSPFLLFHSPTSAFLSSLGCAPGDERDH